MKTFEERYTAWIDGQLEGSALTAFEQELARRAEAGDAETAEADKVAALRLRSLLKEHLRAPALTNNEFFSHQMRERIDVEVGRAAARREANRRPAFRFPALAWPFVRLAGAGVLCLFVAGALYYGMAPSQRQSAPMVVQTGQPTLPPGADDQAAPSAPSNLTPQVSGGQRPPDNEYVKLDTPMPTPIDISDDAPAVTLTGGNGTSTATSLHVGNANVLWLDNPPYLPSSPATASPAPAAPSPAAIPSTAPVAPATAAPVPAASATP